jgi:hypothetical protein
MQKLWDAKTKYQRKDEDTAQSFYERAGIWAEFGKIVCISVGFFTKETPTGFRVNHLRGTMSVNF